MQLVIKAHRREETGKREQGMHKATKKMSIMSRSLRPQLVVAFCIMSVIPILALLYLIFSGVLALNILLPVLGAVIVLSLLGFF